MRDDATIPRFFLLKKCNDRDEFSSLPCRRCANDRDEHGLQAGGNLGWNTVRACLLGRLQNEYVRVKPLMSCSDPKFLPVVHRRVY